MCRKIRCDGKFWNFLETKQDKNSNSSTFFQCTRPFMHGSSQRRDFLQELARTEHRPDSRLGDSRVASGVHPCIWDDRAYARSTMMTRRSPPRVAHTGVTLRMHGFHLKLDLPDEKGGTTRDSYSPVIPSQIRRRVYQNHEKKTWQTHDDRDAVRHPCDRVSRVGHRSNDRAAGPRALCVPLHDRGPAWGHTSRNAWIPVSLAPYAALSITSYYKCIQECTS